MHVGIVFTLGLIFRLFIPWGRQVALIKVKFGSEEQTLCFYQIYRVNVGFHSLHNFAKFGCFISINDKTMNNLPRLGHFQINFWWSLAAKLLYQLMYPKVCVSNVTAGLDDADWSVVVNICDVAMDAFTWQQDRRRDSYNSKHLMAVFAWRFTPGVRIFHMCPWDIAMGGLRNSSFNSVDFRSWFPAIVIIIFKTNAGCWHIINMDFTLTVLTF